MDNWLPYGFTFNDGSKLRKCIIKEKGWELYSTSKDGLALAVLCSIYDEWKKDGMIYDGLFTKEGFDEKEYMTIVVPHGNIIASVKKGPYPETNVEAEAFALTLKKFRELYPEKNCSEAIYLEREGVILPISSGGEIDDALVLGRWISQGVNISVNSFGRLCELMAWMPPNEIEKISNAAGINVSDIEKETVTNSKAIPKSNRPKSKEIIRSERFTLVGRPELENFLNDHVIDIIRNETQYKRMGINSPSGIILYGPPGCGKTYAVEQLIEYLGWPDYSIDSSTIGSMYIHDTSKKISEIFDVAIENSPSIVVIDEMEAFLMNRNAESSDAGHHIEEVAEFLRKIPEALSKGVLIIAMTNMIDSIDPAIRRRGRFDHIIEVKMPTSEEVFELLQYMLKDIPTNPKLDLTIISKKLENHPFSDVTFVIKEAGRLAVKEKREFIDEELLQNAFDGLPIESKSHRKIGFVIDDV